MTRRAQATPAQTQDDFGLGFDPDSDLALEALGLCARLLCQDIWSQTNNVHCYFIQ